MSFAGAMAHALGCKTGIVTSAGPEADLSPLAGIDVVSIPASVSTTFENRYADGVRTQYLHHRASNLRAADVPADWQAAPIAHLAPLDDEIDLAIIEQLSDSFIGLTPQGLMRRWNDDGLVSRAEWRRAFEVLPAIHATVLSIEDIEGDWALADRWAGATRILVVTQAESGATFYFDGKRQPLPAPRVAVADPTGAGDLFAAAFFVRLRETDDVLTAGRFAIALASASVTRSGLASLPSADEIEAARALQ